MYYIKFKDGTEKEFESLEGANLSHSTLFRSDFRYVNLSNADLSYANLRCAYLEGADLSGARLNHADLFDANLKDATLYHADLIGADLSGADLSGANIKDTDLDYSCLPLWYGGLGMKIDSKIARQLVYHAFAQECDDPEYQRLKELCKDFANKFHRVESKDCEKIGD